MFHVICRLPNASLLINGIKFAEHEMGAVITCDPVAKDTAEHFGSIPGYEIVEVKPASASAGGAKKPAATGDVGPTGQPTNDAPAAPKNRGGRPRKTPAAADASTGGADAGGDKAEGSAASGTGDGADHGGTDDGAGENSGTDGGASGESGATD